MEFYGEQLSSGEMMGYLELHILNELDWILRFQILTLQNWDTQDDITFRITNLKMFAEILLLSY